MEKYVPGVTERSRLVSHYENSHAFTSEARGVYNVEDGYLRTVDLHAEMIIALEILQKNPSSRSFIGVSKRCCYLCHEFITQMQGLGYKAHVRSTHSRLYPRWMLPPVGDHP